MSNDLPMQLGDAPKIWATTELPEALTAFRSSGRVSVGVKRVVSWFRAYYGR